MCMRRNHWAWKHQHYNIAYDCDGDDDDIDDNDDADTSPGISENMLGSKRWVRVVFDNDRYYDCSDRNMY